MKFSCRIVILILLCTVQAQAHRHDIDIAYDSAIAQYIRTDNQAAISSFRAVINGAKNTKDTTALKKVVKSYAFLAGIYTTQGVFTTALENYYLGLAVADKINDLDGRAQILLGIGELYFYWHRYEQAMQYYTSSEKILHRTGNEKLLADCYIHKGAIYEQQAQFGTALSYYNKSLAIFEKLHHTNNMTAVLTNIGNVYSALGQYDKGIAHLNRALSIAKEFRNKDNILYCLINLGIVYDTTGDYKTAEHYWTQSIALAEETGSIESQITAYEAVASLAARKGDFEQAYRMNVRYSRLKDSLFNAQSLKQIQEINTRYETEKKERKITEQAWMIQKQKNRNQWLALMLIGGTVIVSVGLIYYVQRNRAKQEKERFKAMLKAEQQERMRIARDLHDSLGQKLTAVSLQLGSQTAATRDGNGYSATKALLDDAIQEVRHISHNLIPEELHFGIITALEELCMKMQTAETIINLKIDPRFTPGNLSEQFELSVYRIIQELLNNILKHAASGRIDIALLQDGSSWIIDVRDNGKGFNTTSIHTSAGLGWKNILARVSLLNGKMTVSSETAKGTHIKITFPL